MVSGIMDPSSGAVLRPPSIAVYGPTTLDIVFSTFLLDNQVRDDMLLLTLVGLRNLLRYRRLLLWNLMLHNLVLC